MKNIKDYLPSAHWLCKTEPSVFSFEDLLHKKTTLWDGIRNYQVRNFIRDHIKVDHKIIIYHSNANPPGIAGLASVIGEPVVEEGPWFSFPIGKPKSLQRYVSLSELREVPEIKDMLLLRKGQRLSIMPLTEEEYNVIIGLANQDQ